MKKNKGKEENLPVIPLKKWNLPAIKKISPIELDRLNLNNREKIFVILYCSNGFRCKEAYAGAGYKYKTEERLDKDSIKMLYRDRIQEAVRKIVDVMIAPFLGKIPYFSYLTLYARAFYKIQDFYNDDGTIKPLKDIPEELSRVIDGVTIRFYGKDCSEKVIEYKLPNRNEALKAINELLEKASGSSDQSFEQLRQLKESIFNREKNIIDFKEGG